MLEGIEIKSLKRIHDERGFFIELMRKNWNELFDEDEIAQANFSMSYPGVVRAWHRHLKGQVDYFLVLKGALKICAYNEKLGELTEIVSTAHDLQIVRIPGLYWHGFKVISEEPAWLLYFVNQLYDYENPDEERRPWNDPLILPKSINGKTDDPRILKSWDWLTIPYK